ncbi:MAG TPA: branched-chain amino acid ABC transporter permease [Candidatus Baltobacteraceae bacterium]|nr:branched-chain amino acid ABC transporter permease [Candidatus Baltobacteraceae bacterium]
MGVILAQVAVSGILLGGVYALISIGLTLIFGVLRVVNFAHGEFLMIAMYASFWLFHQYGLDPYVSIPIVVALLFVVGVIAMLLVIRPILRASPSMQIAATVGLSTLLQNLALVTLTANYRSVETKLSRMVLSIGPLVMGVSRLVAFLVALAITGLLFLFLQRTYLGKAIRCTAQDRTAALLMGINIDRVYLLTFAIGSALVGVAGALLMQLYPVFPTVGTYFVLAAFVVVVLGGLGNLTGALLGGFIIGLVEAFSGFYVPELKEAVYFVVFIIVLLVRPTGLFGVVGAEEVGLK